MSSYHIFTDKKIERKEKTRTNDECQCVNAKIADIRREYNVRVTSFGGFLANHFTLIRENIYN